MHAIPRLNRSKNNFQCAACAFRCSKESSYIRHNMTLKHLERSKRAESLNGFERILNGLAPKEPKKEPPSGEIELKIDEMRPTGDDGSFSEKPALFSDLLGPPLQACKDKVREQIKKDVDGMFKCKNCNIAYKGRNGLWYHQQKCTNDPTNTDSIEETVTSQPPALTTTQLLTTIMYDIMKNNTEMQKQQQEFFKQLFANNSATHMVANATLPQLPNNNGTKPFNLQLFLNEHCKEAMNLNEFIDSINLTLDDLESVGEQGFVEGISSIIIKKLNATEMHMRPIHCSDLKREILYIKQNDKWEKDGPNHDNMRLFVQHIERKNIRLLQAYCQKHPDHMDMDSPFNDHYLRITGEATCATEVHINKVISRIAKDIMIPK